MFTYSCTRYLPSSLYTENSSANKVQEAPSAQDAEKAKLGKPDRHSHALSGLTVKCIYPRTLSPCQESVYPMNFVHFAEPSWAGRCYEAKNQIKDQAEGSTALAPSEKVLKEEDVVPT